MLPKKGKIYNFFDDGKIRRSRLYKAYVKKIIPFNEANIHLKIAFVTNAICHRACFSHYSKYGRCGETTRNDGIGVIFKIINMENNQITIDIPNGMEIDVENSNLSKGIIKFIKKSISLVDVSTGLYSKRITSYVSSLNLSSSSYETNYLLAVARLQDIAQYYNNSWVYVPGVDDIKGYHIVYDNSIKGKFSVRPLYSSADVYAGQVVFKNEEDAQAVISNPNFRDVLNKVYRV